MVFVYDHFNKFTRGRSYRNYTGYRVDLQYVCLKFLTDSFRDVWYTKVNLSQKFRLLHWRQFRESVQLVKFSVRKKKHLQKDDKSLCMNVYNLICPENIYSIFILFLMKFFFRLGVTLCFIIFWQVRATNLQELVYKNGQAGVTKATVTIVFDNSDKKQSPIGYEHYNEVTITRQVRVCMMFLDLNKLILSAVSITITTYCFTKIW